MSNRLNSSDVKALNERLFDAVFYGEYDVIRTLLADGANPNIFDQKGDALLIIAVRYSPSTVKILLDAKADPNIQSKLDGTTPLWWAAKLNHVYLIKMLLDAGADPNIVSNSGTTPLNNISYNENVDAVKILLDAGADPNIADKDGRTPLYWAVEYDNLDLYAALLKAGADRGKLP